MFNMKLAAKVSSILRSKFRILRDRYAGKIIQIERKTQQHGSCYGGWTLDPDPLGKESIIYSFGIGEDASFDRSVIDYFGAEVFAFDPTPRSITWVRSQEWPEQFNFFPVGIANHDGLQNFFPPENPAFVSYSFLKPEIDQREEPIRVEVRRLSSLAERLGHGYIDVLKLDIEGAEYQVIPDILHQGTVIIGQILVEFHDVFPQIPARKTRKMIHLLNKSGYRIFSISPKGSEISLIRIDEYPPQSGKSNKTRC